MFKTGTMLSIKSGVAKACNNGRCDVTVRQLARACNVSVNTIYKLWDVCRVTGHGSSVWVDGASYKLFAYDTDGVKVFNIWASGV